VIARHLADDTSLRSVLLLGMEQTTIPRNLDLGVPIPAKSLAGAAVLRRQASSVGLKVLGCGQFSEQDRYDPQDPVDLLRHVLDQLGRTADAVTLLTQRSGAFHKRLRYRLDTEGLEDPVDIRFLDPAPTALNGLKAMAMALDPGRAHRPVTLLFDEDVESLRMGWLALERTAS